MAKQFELGSADLQTSLRNTFDKSFTTNGSFNFGKLYPVYSRPVIAGEDIRINTRLGLQFLPMAFPTQTNIRVHTHWFYVRNRSLWKNWTEFTTLADMTRPKDGKKNVVHPYIQINETNKAKYLVSGGLGDWLGLPTTLANKESNVRVSYRQYKEPVVRRRYFDDKISNPLENKNAFVGDGSSNRPLLRDLYSGPSLKVSPGSELFGFVTDIPLHNDVVNDNFGIVTKGILSSDDFRRILLTSNNQIYICFWRRNRSDNNTTFDLVNQHRSYSSTTHSNGIKVKRFTVELVSGGTTNGDGYYTCRIVGLAAAIKEIRALVPGGSVHMGLFSETSVQSSYKLYDNSKVSPYGVSYSNPNFVGIVGLVATHQGASLQSAISVPTPFEDKDNPILLNALKFRAYESIYNSYYRNEKIDPFTLKGVIEYDLFCNQDDGNDTFDYDLHYRNWEQDYLTTALPSPQLGDAPYVELNGEFDSKYLNFDIVDPKSKVKYALKADLTQGSNVVWKFGSSEVPDDLLGLITATKSGIRVESIRDATSLQRYLEARIRSGYRYRDVMRSIYGENIKYSALNIPEYLGGDSNTVNINTILNQSSGTSPLGEYGGTGFCTSNTNSINCHCDEHGFVFCILSIMPSALYSQRMPKDVICPTSILDYHNVAFNNIGLQPIRLSEVAPLQAYSNGVKTGDIFGYQRPYYDVISNVDEVHGDLREESLQGYVISRYFGGVPLLNREFVVCDPSTINTPFVDATANSDIAIGAIDFRIESKLPLPYRNLASVL